MTKNNRIARALSRVSTEPTERGCLLWEGPASSGGYGQVSLSDRTVKTHRIAWAFGLSGERHGALPPPEVVIRHRCDNPLCNNPAHLQAGSTADNNRDRDERGRTSRGDAHYSRLRPERLARGAANGTRKRPERLARGEANGRAKLSEAAVSKIRELRSDGLTQRVIAVLVGCHQTHVGRILRGLTRAPFNPTAGF